jgi:hypothetical protein
MNDLLYVTAALALVGGVCAAALIRRKDFHQSASAASEAADPATGRSATETVS